MEWFPVFVEVVRQGSFSAAARHLGMPKSSVSRRVAHLERALGVELLTRTTRQLRLTEAGTDLYERVAPALDRLEDAARSMEERQTTPRGLLRVTAPMDLNHDFLAEMVGAFVQRHPDVRVDVLITNRVVDLVGEGVDVAIRAGRVMDSASLVARRLGSSDLGLFAASPYLARRGVPMSVQELGQHDCVLFRSRGGVSRWDLQGPGGEESVDVRGPISADDFTFVQAAVRAGAGIGLIPLALAPQGELVRVLSTHFISGGGTYLVYPRARHLPAALAAFRDHAVEHFRRTAWWNGGR